MQLFLCIETGKKRTKTQLINNQAIENNKRQTQNHKQLKNS